MMCSGRTERQVMDESKPIALRRSASMRVKRLDSHTDLNQISSHIQHEGEIVIYIVRLKCLFIELQLRGNHDDQLEVILELRELEELGTIYTCTCKLFSYMDL